MEIICKNCGQKFNARPLSGDKKIRKFCSKNCFEKFRRGGIKYSQNSDFFENWSGDMAYILGFIYADGCIYKPSKVKPSYANFSDRLTIAIYLKIKSY